MTLGIAWNEPLTGSAEDAAAAERLQAFNGGFFLDPLYTGDWGELRKRLHGPLLPAFTPDQRRLLLENQVGRPCLACSFCACCRLSPCHVVSRSPHPLPHPALHLQQDFLALQHYTGAYAWLNASSAPLNASEHSGLHPLVCSAPAANGLSLKHGSDPCLLPCACLP